MSEINLKPLYEFCQVKVIDQFISLDVKMINIVTKPDERYNPICSRCHSICPSVHSYAERCVRDMNVFDFKTTVTCCYRKVRCINCGIVVENISMIEPGMRITKRLADYIVVLCHFMTITDVAKHIGLGWNTVKEIHKQYLLEKFSNEDFGKPRILAVDEIAIRKGHNYLTVVINWETRRVLYVGQDRKTETLNKFYRLLTKEQRDGIEAVAMDMWKPFIKATQNCLPKASIIFDQFHVIKTFGKVIDKIRVSEYAKASTEDRAVIKGSRFILLKNAENLFDDQKAKLQELVAINKNISTVLILKDQLKKLWDYKYQAVAEKFLEDWCNFAIESGIKHLKTFVKTLKNHAYGILSHCKHQIHTSLLEGINNKIKVIKRKAYGFNDIEYFTLVIKEAFFSN